MSNLKTHPQPLLLKREGAKTSSLLSFLKVPLFVREGFRVSLLLITQAQIPWINIQNISLNVHLIHY